MGFNFIFKYAAENDAVMKTKACSRKYQPKQENTVWKKHSKALNNRRNQVHLFYYVFKEEIRKKV